ncbi:diguanylate cyclase [Methylovorus sp. MM2]|uniref:GGDEF domain-containing protein n=1 Tax=Methylovorus sp. MM2 TaxID=1848038 RepID=UPI0007E135A3|nr:GGDEF domain-containing protein [Methylovorus sp. MM2]OAM52853.1 diguanylate cyclase [Methylovorus sp. MM2]
MAISHELLRLAALDKWTLNFKDKRLETFYRQYALPNLRRQARVALLLGAILYGSYGFLDFLFVSPNSVVEVWYIRTMVLTVAFAVLALTYTKRFARYNQIFLALSGIAGGLGLLAKMFLLPNFVIAYLYTGLILITFWCHYLSGLRFINASIVGSIIFVIFNYLFFGERNLPRASIVIYDFFMIGANIIGGFASYIGEKQHRILFLREKELDKERRLQHERALHDRLTGLPNRELLHDRISQSINYSLRNDEVCAGLFLDLDKFKPINDIHGHAIGDLVLQEVARRLKYAMREADTISRLGGDEFFVLAKNIQSESAADKLAKKIKQQLDKPIRIPNGPLIDDLSVSIGICMFPYKEATAIDVVRRADHAMYEVKRASKAAKGEPVSRD